MKTAALNREIECAPNKRKRKEKGETETAVSGMKRGSDLALYKGIAHFLAKKGGREKTDARTALKKNGENLLVSGQ